MKFYIETYGCAANKNDSEIMVKLLIDAGFTISNLQDADLIIINTCTVKQATKSKMIERIKFLSSLNKPLIVAGCFPKVETKRVEKINPKASLIGPNAIDRIVEVAKKTLNGEKVVILEGSANKSILPSYRFNPIIEIVQISSGCLSACTFCITRFSRGMLKSYRIGDIKRKIEGAVKSGAKEIWITSQDNSAYGRDIGTNLIELLEEIVKVEGKFWIRVGMMNPLHFKKIEVEKLTEIFKNKKIFKFLHIPVQSGSNKVLKDMKRGYTVEEFLDWVKIFRKKIRKITISTDIIVGFPTETEKDFEETVELLRKLKPDVVNLSKFSLHHQTEASKFKQLNSKIIDERSKFLTKIIREILEKKNKKWKNWKGIALVDEKVKNGFVARNIYYKPIFLKNANFGEFVKVKIEETFPTFLIGKII
jgi:MiaB-like tRNA modifying enzyme